MMMVTKLLPSFRTLEEYTLIIKKENVMLFLLQLLFFPSIHLRFLCYSFMYKVKMHNQHQKNENDKKNEQFH